MFSFTSTVQIWHQYVENNSCNGWFSSFLTVFLRLWPWKLTDIAHLRTWPSDYDYTQSDLISSKSDDSFLSYCVYRQSDRHTHTQTDRHTDKSDHNTPSQNLWRGKKELSPLFLETDRKQKPTTHAHHITYIYTHTIIHTPTISQHGDKLSWK